VAGFYNQTPLIEFVRKGRDVTNITGEKLHVNQLIQAMAEAEGAAGIRIKHYRGFADGEKSRYAFLVEFEAAPPAPEPLARLLAEIDFRLRELNIEYDQKRESRRLGAPVLWVMKPGWFERKVSVGRQRSGRDVQFKAQLLAALPEDEDEIEVVVESAAQAASDDKAG
jgi:hypothetical protein